MGNGLRAALDENIELDLRLDGMLLSIPSTRTGAAQVDYHLPVTHVAVKSDYPLVLGILRDYEGICQAELVRSERAFSQDIHLEAGDRLSILYGHKSDKFIAIDIIARPEIVALPEPALDYHQQLQKWSLSGKRFMESELQNATNAYIKQEFRVRREGQKGDPLLRDVLRRLNGSDYPQMLMQRDKTMYTQYKRLLRLVAEE